METLKLNSNGKVVIPGLGTGKKKLIIKKLNDEIQHIPDTYSIDVDIETKQGLLPPERVTQKENYPLFKTLESGVFSSMLGIPHQCNGFIPDYIDTQNLTVGDRVYIIDPKHDDTSKYVLDENKQWIYVGDYNDPAIGGVEGNDYSDFYSDLGGLWLIRQNKDVPVKIYNKVLVKNQKWDVIKNNLIETGDIAFGYYGTNVWMYKVNISGDIGVQVGAQITNSGISNFDTSGHDGSTDGCFIWKKSDIDSGNAPIWVTSNNPAPDLSEYDQVIQPPEDLSDSSIQFGRSNLMVNTTDSAIFINDLQFDGVVNPADTMVVPKPGGNLQISYTNGLFTSTEKYVKSGRVAQASNYGAYIPAGHAFWYVRRDSTPLTMHLN